jgi:hypothetical protein
MLTVISTMVNGKTIKLMAMVHIHTPMEHYIRATGLKTSNMVRVKNNGLMVHVTKATMLQV